MFFADCKAESSSRKTVRWLKEIGVEIRFEKENINSLDLDGEVMLIHFCVQTKNQGHALGIKLGGYMG